MVFAKGLKDDGDHRHDGFDNTELKSRLENTIKMQNKTQVRVAGRGRRGEYEG